MIAKAKYWIDTHIKNSAIPIIRLEYESKMYEVIITPAHAKSSIFEYACRLVDKLKICAMRNMLNVYSKAPKIIRDLPILE